VYSFNYVSPSATINTVYNGFAQCEVPVTVQEHFIVEKTFVYPNPFHDKILAFGSQSKQSFVLMDVRGNVIFSGPDLESQNFSNLSGGIYFLRTHNYTHRLMKR
jgi:hypothetical protein